MAAKPLMAESFSGRQRLFKNVWRGIASSTSTKLIKPLKHPKLIRTARIDDDKPPVVLHKYKRKIRAKKMVNDCNKILNYCDEHGLTRHILAQRAEEDVSSNLRRKKKRIRAKKTVKGSPHSLTTAKTLHVKCETQQSASHDKALSLEASKKKIRKIRRKKKTSNLKKKEQNSETMRTWLNVELLKQSLNKSNWPDRQATMIKSLKGPHSMILEKQNPTENVTKRSASVNEFPKRTECSTEGLKTICSLREIRRRKSRPRASKSQSSKIESIKEVVTPVESSNVLTQKVKSEIARPTSVASTTKSILKSSAANKISSKPVVLVPSATESMDSVQKSVTDYVAYLKTNSKDSNSIEKFKEVMRVVESRRSTPKRVVSTLTCKTSIPKSLGSISRRFSSKMPTIEDIQNTVKELTRNVAVTRVQSMKSPTPLNPIVVQKVARRVESASYPSSPICSTPSK